MPNKTRYAKLLLIICLYSASVTANEYTLAIHPVLPQEQTQNTYQPLVNYLRGKTGHRFQIITTSNFLSHWEAIKKGKYDLVLDGPQFTGYRLEKLNYHVLARFPDVVSYTLVASENEMILEPEELIGKIIATTPSPALGALRLQEIFPNPLRQPRILEANDSITAAKQVLEGKAQAAIIPAAMVGAYPQLTTVRNTEQVPSPAISASPKMDAGIRAAISKALLEAAQSEDGKKALEAINITRFEVSDGKEYRPHATLLEEMWNY